MSLKYDNNSSMKTLKYDNKSYMKTLKYDNKSCIKTLKYDYKKSLKIPESNQNTYIEERQTTQWPKEKGQRKIMIYKTLHIKLNIEKHEPH
jgi:hypothetical protein